MGSEGSVWEKDDEHGNRSGGEGSEREGGGGSGKEEERGSDVELLGNSAA